jgi:hypothetical protein
MLFHISGSHFHFIEGASFAFRLQYVHPPYNWIPQQLGIESTWLLSSIQRGTNSFVVPFPVFAFFLLCFEIYLRVHGAVIEIAIIIV